MKRQLIIELCEEDGDKMIVARVLELLSEGYTSGYEQHWQIKETLD